MVDLDKVKTAMKEIANPTDRLIINRSYYSMYHAARAAVYVQLQLDVEKHQALIEKFKKLLIREFDSTTLSDAMDKWRIRRNDCDYTLISTAFINL